MPYCDIACNARFLYLLYLSDSCMTDLIFLKAPAIMGRTEGETCQLGMLELYYEILCVE